MANEIYFVNDVTNTIYKTKFAQSIIKFAEFDLSFFMGQAIEFGEKARESGKYPLKESYIIRDLLKDAHPYIAANFSGKYDKIVVDCIIENICRTQEIGESSLWNKYISPKTELDKMIFARLSDYKCNRAANEWLDIVRLQDYTRNKLDFIFKGTKNIEDANIKKNYFDLTFSVISRELGCSDKGLGKISTYNKSLLPNSVFMISRMSKEIYKSIETGIEDANLVPTPKFPEDGLSDQISMDIYSYMRKLQPPIDTELGWIRSMFGEIEDTIYKPAGFKPLLDLEFDKIISNNILLQPCARCARYYESTINYNGEYCDIVGTDGKTCREHSAANNENPIPKELNKRCEEVHSLVKRNIGTQIDENEFEEWEQYLNSMKTNIEKNYATPDELEKFLEYTQRMYSQITDQE
mgnify:CR=1 FL=1